MFVLPLAERMIRRRLLSIGIGSHYHATPQGRIHYYEAKGAGDGPPLVILHGFGASGSSYGRVLALLRRRVRQIWVPEAPAHGFSSSASGRLTVDDAYAALCDFLHAHVREPAIFFGNSLGGAFAIRYALEHPTRVRGLLLASPAGALLDAQDFAALTGSFRVRSLSQARQLLDRLYHEPPWYNSLLAPDILRRFALGPLRHCLESFRPEHMFTPDELAALTPPTLILWGRSERLLPSASLEFFRRALPAHVRIEEPDEFGHCPYLDRPRMVADKIAAFVEEMR
jgi:pimeloyl-ACP methyl ester carboxylesterase